VTLKLSLKFWNCFWLEIITNKTAETNYSTLAQWTTKFPFSPAQERNWLDLGNGTWVFSCPGYSLLVTDFYTPAELPSDHSVCCRFSQHTVQYNCTMWLKTLSSRRKIHFTKKLQSSACMPLQHRHALSVYPHFVGRLLFIYSRYCSFSLNIHNSRTDYFPNMWLATARAQTLWC